MQDSLHILRCSSDEELVEQGLGEDPQALDNHLEVREEGHSLPGGVAQLLGIQILVQREVVPAAERIQEHQT